MAPAVPEPGAPVLVNARTQRVIPFTPSAPGREAAPERNNPLKHNADGWVESMAKHYADVCPPELWRVHGQLYNFESYMDTHPGGRIFLEQTRGSDCTEAFEAHHIRGVNKVLMEKHRVKDPVKTLKDSIPERFSYDKNFMPIKKFVANYLEKELHDPLGSTPMWAGAMYSAIVLQFLLMARWAAKRQSYTLAAVAGVLLSGCWGVGHNQVHRGRKTSWWNLLRYAMDLTGFSSYETTVTHAMSHHQNANTQYDIEVYNFQEIGLYFLTNEPKNSLWPFRQGAFLISSAATAPFLVITRLVQRIIERKLLSEDVLIPAALVAMMSKEAGSASKGLKLAMFMWASFSAWFVPMSFALHHVEDPETGSPLCYHDGEPTDFQHDFAAHQIVATLDHSVGLNDYVACTLFAHLNVHTLHHIFPTIDRVHHEPILKALLKENVGHFREVYELRNKVGKSFWTELWPNVYRFIMNRRFEPISKKD